MDIQFISKQDCYELRQRVLRPGRPALECLFPCDEDARTFHVGVSVDKKILSICTFAYEQAPNELFTTVRNEINQTPYSYRLRGMATEPEHHKKGLGAKALAFAEVELQKRFADLLWFNARENAFGFYERLGYKYFGEMFDIENVGPHKVMYKVIKNR